MPEKARHASPCFPSASPSAWVARPLLTLLRSTKRSITTNAYPNARARPCSTRPEPLRLSLHLQQVNNAAGVFSLVTGAGGQRVAAALTALNV